MSLPNFRRRIEEALPRVLDRIAAAAERSAREPGAVRIVAVTKGHPQEAVEAVLDAGLADVGENRVEELEEKAPAFRGRRARWHMIGHVQGRKAARAARLAELLHSVDSLRLAGRLSRAAEGAGTRLPVLVQVNASGEAAKGGFPVTGRPEAAWQEALEGIAEVAALPGLRPVGLMTMAPFTSDDSVVRAAFRRTRKVLEAAAEIEGFDARELSMGMSNDYETAVEEGSTIVRLGTILLGERPRRVELRRRSARRPAAAGQAPPR